MYFFFYFFYFLYIAKTSASSACDMLLSSWPWNVLCFSCLLFSYRVQRVYGTNRGEVPIGVSCKWACAGGLVEKLQSHSVDNNLWLERLLVKVHLSREPQWDQHLLYKKKKLITYIQHHTLSSWQNYLRSCVGTSLNNIYSTRNTPRHHQCRYHFLAELPC